MNDKEYQLVLPYIILPGKKDYDITISAPDGQLLQFRISQDVAEKIGDVMTDHQLWQTFFSSLINAMEIQVKND